MTTDVLFTAALLVAAAVACLMALRRMRALKTQVTSLQRQARWYHDALRIAGAGVWQWNMRDNQWMWIENLFQVPGSDLSYRVEVGPDFHARVHPEDRERLHEAERACIAGNSSLFDDYRYTLDDGRERWLRDIGHEIATGPGEPRTMVGITLDITDEKLRALAEEERSSRDDLTGLANRRAMREQVEALCTQDAGFCVAFLDLNGFKRLNDRHGHAAGDRCLQALGRTLRSLCREDEMAARIGGDEFVLVIPASPGNENDALLRVKLVVEAAVQIATRANPDAPVGAAVGIAFHPAHGVEAAALLSNADAAMYAAKGSGEHLTFRVHGEADELFRRSA